MKRFFIIALLMVGGCDYESKGADGYAFENPEFTQANLQIEFKLHDDIRSLRRELPAGNLSADREAMGWARVNPREKRCEVHIMDPAADYQPEWIGHEIAHCIYGRWHR